MIDEGTTIGKRKPSDDESTVTRLPGAADPAPDRDAPTLGPQVNGPAADAPSATQPLANLREQATFAPASDARCLNTDVLETVVQATSVVGRGRQFGDYELLEEIARGGMGVVFKARQRKLNRVVALKMILAGEHASKSALERFRAEAEAAANLDHPNIVPIYEVGDCEGRQFFSMGFVEGGSLADKLATGPLPPKLASRLMIDVADAVHYAHECGVVHRDLKPANILLARTSGSSDALRLSNSGLSPLKETDPAMKIFKASSATIQNLTPKITDFGLAKRMQSTGSGHTAAGEILGTPSYMPPEQAAGRGDEIGPLADVYSLGALLYATVTGRPPFQAANVMDTLVQVLEREPIRPRALNPVVDRDLETICLKAMEKQPDRRYASAADFSDDLKRYLRQEPIVARRISTASRCLRWCRRNRVAAAAMSVVGFMIAAIIVVAPAAAYRESSLREEADDQRLKALEMSREAESQREEATQQFQKANQLLYASQMQLADREIAAGRMRAARLLLERAEPTLRGWEWHYLTGQLEAEEFRFNGHNGECPQIAFDAAGRLLFSLGSDGRVCVWDLRQASKIADIDAKTALQSLAIHPASGVVAVLTSNGKLLAVDWKKKSISTVNAEFGVGKRVVFSPDGKWIAQAANTGVVRLSPWSAESLSNTDSSKKIELVGHKGPLHSVAFSPDGALVATGGRDSVVRVYDVATGTLRHALVGHAMDVYEVAFSPDGKLLASGGWDTSVRVWEVASGRLLKTLREAEAPVESVSFDPTGDWIVGGTWEGVVRIWDADSGSLRLTHRGHEHFVRCVRFSPADRLLASCSANGDIRLWDAQRIRNPLTLGRTNAPVPTSAFNATGDMVAAAGVDGTLRFFDVRAGRRLGDVRIGGVPVAAWFERQASSPPGSAISADSTPRRAGVEPEPVAILTTDGRVRRWKSIAGKPDIVSPIGDQTVTAAYVGDDGLALACADGSVFEAKLPTAPPRLVCRLENTIPKSISLNRQGGLIFVGSEGTAGSGVVQMIGLGDGAVRTTWTAHEAPTQMQEFLGVRSTHAVLALWCDSEGNRLFTGSGDRTIRVWDLKSGKIIGILEGHSGHIVALTPTRDARRLISSGYEGAIKIWDLATLTELLTLPHAGWGTTLSADGVELISGYWDRSVKLWSSKPRSLEQRRDRLMVRTAWAIDPQDAANWRKSLESDSTLSTNRRVSMQLTFDELPKTATELNDTCWRSVRRPGLAPQLYRRADALIQSALNLPMSAFERRDVLNTAGVAKYRVGDFAAAIDYLKQSDTLVRTRQKTSSISDLAFLAMSYMAKGDRKQAGEFLRQAQGVAAVRGTDTTGEDAAFIAEAVGRIAESFPAR